MKKILLITLTTFALFSLSVQADLLKVQHEHNWEEVITFSSADYKSALKSAKKEINKAKKAGVLWNTIGGKKGLLTKAKKLEKKGNFKDAIELVNLAKSHAILGQKQAIAQANAGPSF